MSSPEISAQNLFRFTHLNQLNADYVDLLHTQYLENPDSVDESWRYFFEGIEIGAETAHTNGYANGHAAPGASASTDTTSTDWLGEIKVLELIEAYRARGTWMADIDPLTAAPSSHPALEITAFGFTSTDLSKTFQAAKFIGMSPSKLSDIIAQLKAIYCGTIGFETAHILNNEERKWLQNKLEVQKGSANLDHETRKYILKRLSQSETFERFLHTRYVAQKRFSVEGGEAAIPSLDCMIETAAAQGATDFVIGMAHRGRLNVLHNLFGKKAESMFTEFEGNYKVDYSHGEGDVKYHKGYSIDLTTRQGSKAHLSLAYNPSHLEFVNAVVEGTARAKQDRLKDTDRSKVIPILIHGDAAFAGQGVCYEIMNLSQLDGYKTGGTLHLVINNQVGFTTNPSDSRSTQYCTDLAKMLDAPIFHVNGDDADAVWFITRLATEYRNRYKKDVFIDLICYRKHGHNEGDEPTFTQPLLYKKIKGHASPREMYAKKLVTAGVMSETETQAMIDEITAGYMEAQKIAKEKAPYDYGSVLQGAWKGLDQPHESNDLFRPVNTAVSEKTLKSIAEKINGMPSGFHLHSKLGRFFEARVAAVRDGKGLDWGNAETLAYASLVVEGNPVRLSGQDAERGTFTHRHCVVTDFETGQKYSPLNHIQEGQATFMVHNSHLSETGVMGFEYGYSLAAPQTLCIWEAQFGDFANGAQVIIDQFLASSESKWQRMSGLVLLLPHGYEGQGPEHSSARLERFLQLCGRDNMTVANLSTPAQIFHALRRQVKREFRKPLVVMSPKSLLRHPQAISTVADLSEGAFQEVIDDAQADAKKIKRVLMCSGKIYYELLNERTAKKRDDVAIVRVEQIYPWPAEKLAKILANYANAQQLVWVQEEPRNMGAWTFVFNQWSGGLDSFQDQVGARPIKYVGRDAAASPAVGYAKLHEAEQKKLVETAISG